MYVDLLGHLCKDLYTLNDVTDVRSDYGSPLRQKTQLALPPAIYIYGEMYGNI
jgi:hypothetical protein